MSHIIFQTLIDYVEEQLSPDTAAEVTNHLTNCVQCQHELMLVRQFLAYIRGFDLQTPQAGLLQLAVAAFRQQQQRLPNRPQHLGHLHYDNWQATILTNARGLPGEHQLLYQANGYDLDLQITQDITTQSYMLRGQILTTTHLQAGIEGCSIHLISDVTIERGALADHLGRFQFSYLPKGIYQLSISVADIDIIIDSVRVDHEVQ